MAWTTPMTAVANSIFLASQFNTYVRDNLNETMPAKATSAGQYFVTTGANAIVARSPVSNTVTTVQQGFTGNGGYQDITNGAVTVTTGTSALVHISGWQQNTTAADNAIIISYRVSGATTQTPNDHHDVITWDGINTTQGARMGTWGHNTTLTSGSNTFTMQAYAPSGNHQDVNWCHIIVIPTS